MRVLWLLFSLFPPSFVFGQVISTVAGTGSSTFSGEGVPAVIANTPNPNGGVFDKYGNYYFADGQNSNRIRKITPIGIISTVAGNGIAGFSGDGGAATNAKLNGPSSVALDTSGNMYISDVQNMRIRKVDIITGIISTIAGTGVGGYYGDGVPATDAMIWGVPNICIDNKNNIYIADAQNARVRKINTLGIITTYAGDGSHGHTGDGTYATAAEVAWPTGIALDDTGSLYIACNSSFSNRVRKVDTFGIITTVVGNGVDTYIGDGVPATDAQLAPTKITVDGSNNLFISDRYNNRVYKVDLISGLFQNVAGTGVVGDAGDGSAATAATLNYPEGLVTDACDNLYITTVGSVSVVGSGRRIRKVTFNPPTTPTVAITGITTASVGTTVTVNAAVSGAGGSYTIKWLNKGIQFATTTVPTVTYTKAAGTDTITARVVPVITYCYDSVASAPHVVNESSVSVSFLSQGVFSVYPNPGHHSLSISGGEVIKSVTITNLVGEVLTNEQPDKEAIQINIAHLQSGMYLLRVNDIIVKRFVKE